MHAMGSMSPMTMKSSPLLLQKISKEQIQRHHLRCVTVPDPKKHRHIVLGSEKKRQTITIWVFPKIKVPQNGWFIMENPIKMDDLGAPLFLETPIYLRFQCSSSECGGVALGA